MGETRINVGRGRVWSVIRYDKKYDTEPMLPSSPFYYCHRRRVIKAQRFMQSMGFTMYCPYFDYVHVPHRSRFDGQVYFNSHNSDGIYFGRTPYEKFHRIEIQRRYMISYGGRRVDEIETSDYMRISRKNKTTRYDYRGDSQKIPYMDKPSMNKLMRVNIYRYL